MKKSILLLFLAMTAAPGATISLESSKATVTRGSTFAIDVAIQGVQDLYAWQLDIGFDPQKLEALAVTEGPFLSSAGTTFFFAGFIDNTQGQIAFNANTLGGAVPGVSGDGILMSMAFRALDLGVTPVTVFNEILLDSFLSGISGTTAVGRSITILQGEVPEPSSIALMVGGIAAIAVMRRRWRPGS